MQELIDCKIERVNREVGHLRELVLAMFASRDKASDVAKESMENRLGSMNEFRDQLREQASRFITRVEHDALIHQVQESQERVFTDIAKASTRIASLDAKLYIGGAGVMMLLTMFQLILNFWHSQVVIR